MINYAFRNKATGKLLIDPKKPFKANNLVESYERDERWSVDNIKTILFIKDTFCHNFSFEEKYSNLNKEYQKEIEIVSIHNSNCIEIITSEDIPQSLLEYFENIDEIVRFSTVKSNFIYNNSKANKKVERYYRKKRELKFTELEKAWAYLEHIGRIPRIIERKEELTLKIAALVKRLTKGCK